LESQGVNWDELLKALKRPMLDAPSTKPFWDDPYIASQMMKFHLDPNVEAASKRHAVIDAECAFLAKALNLKSGMTLVDLGCGPGLYLERWLSTGAQLIGVDLSSVAIETAKKRLNAPITWIEADYRHLPETLKADAMTLIYYDFTALPVKDQVPLLKAIADHLNPGGLLALDVMTPTNHYEESFKITQRENGFWSPDPHTEIHQVFIHESPKVIIDQYTLVNSSGHWDTIRIQNRLLTQVELEGMLKEAGLTPVTWLSDLSGTPYHPSSKTLAVVAQKNHSQP
jgi:ubiquinone/menaquinone biosynthesis C-methylase UbiE